MLRDAALLCCCVRRPGAKSELWFPCSTPLCNGNVRVLLLGVRMHVSPAEGYIKRGVRNNTIQSPMMQCFWRPCFFLNKGFLQALLLRAGQGGALPPGLHPVHPSALRGLRRGGDRRRQGGPRHAQPPFGQAAKARAAYLCVRVCVLSVPVVSACLAPRRDDNDFSRVFGVGVCVVPYVSAGCLGPVGLVRLVRLVRLVLRSLGLVGMARLTARVSFLLGRLSSPLRRAH